MNTFFCKNRFFFQKSKIRDPYTKRFYELDLETRNSLYEVKMQMMLMPGSIGEKIPNVPFKYCEVPDAHGKPIKVIGIARIEEALEKSGIFPGENQTPGKKEYVVFWKKKGFTFHRMSTLLSKLK